MTIARLQIDHKRVDGSGGGGDDDLTANEQTNKNDLEIEM